MQQKSTVKCSNGNAAHNYSLDLFQAVHHVSVQRVKVIELVRSASSATEKVQSVRLNLGDIKEVLHNEERCCKKDSFEIFVVVITFIK